jgi:hypothetical protein
VTALGRRALRLVLEPPAPTATAPPLDVGVIGLSERCGVSTVARGLSLELPGAQVGDGQWPGRAGVLVVVADGSAVAALAALVAERLDAREGPVLLVANRPADPDEWTTAGALCIPASWLGAVLVERGHRARGALGAALRGIAAAILDVAARPTGRRSR